MIYTVLIIVELLANPVPVVQTIGIYDYFSLDACEDDRELFVAQKKHAVCMSVLLDRPKPGAPDGTMPGCCWGQP